MILIRPLLLAASLLVAVLAASRDAAAAATTARLLLPLETARPGETFLAGVELTMQKGWHTYWRNGGDSGQGTSVEWTLPRGITAGDLLWPAPSRYPDADLVTYVLDGTAVLLVPVTIAADAPAGPAEITARVDWLECEKLCVPGKATVRASLVIGTESKASPHAATLAAAAAKLPPTLPEGAASAHWDGPPSGSDRTLLIRWKQPPAGGTPDFLPDAASTHGIGTATDRVKADGDGVVLRKKVRSPDGLWPTRISGLLVTLDAKDRPLQAYEAVLAVDASGEPSASVPVGNRPRSLVHAILFAFLGGIILNVMPCVLPVIALKILGFVRQSGSDPARVRRLGLIYGLGVWVSFLVLAGAVIAVQAAVGTASWGMQFGNPVFLVGMTTLILLVALSLFGLFEINVTGRALDRAGDLATREGGVGAFFNGALAVALATPCTAPFLAPALGYAFTASPTTILVVFTAVAVGLAAPYVLLSWQPALLRFLPRPGPWMERFKVAMGFPMLATAVWLYTLAADHFGPAGPLGLGVFLVVIALAAWIWGEFGQRGSRHPAFARGLAAALGIAAVALILERELHWRSPQPPSASSPTAVTTDGIPWKPWSREAVDAARREGKPVFVDFTADWCWTCKLNERTSINIPEVRQKLAEIGAVAIKADYTRTPPEMTEELKRFGRAGVPLVLVYPATAGAEPVLLPEVLTPGIVLEALEKAR